MSFDPETGIGVVLLMNTGWEDPVWEASASIIELLYDRAESLSEEN